MSGYPIMSRINPPMPGLDEHLKRNGIEAPMPDPLFEWRALVERGFDALWSETLNRFLTFLTEQALSEIANG